MNRAPWCLLAVIAILAGCVETEAPLTDPATSEADESLYGHWIAKQEDDGLVTEFHAFIGKHTVAGNPKGLMEIELVGWTPKAKKVERDEFRYLTVSKLGKSSYLNVITEPADFSKPEGYAKWTKEAGRQLGLARYKCDGKTLELWVANVSDKSVEKLKQLVKDKVLAKKDAIYTADSLAKHLEKNGGEELFDESFLKFTKVSE